MGFWSSLFSLDPPKSDIEQAYEDGQQSGSEGWHGGYFASGRSYEEGMAYKAGQEHALGQRDYQRAKEEGPVCTHWNDHWESGFRSAQDDDSQNS